MTVHFNDTATIGSGATHDQERKKLLWDAGIISLYPILMWNPLLRTHNTLSMIVHLE